MPMSTLARRRPAALVVPVVALLVVAVVGGAFVAWSAFGSRSNANDAGWLDSLDSVQGRWVSRAGYAYDGTTPWTAPVTLTVDGDRLGFDAGCNHLGAQVAVRDHRLHADGGVATTEMGCTPALHARDAWVAALVDDHATIQLKGSTEGPMLMLDTNAGWVGFIRAAQPSPSPSVSDPDEPVSSTPSP